MSGSEDFRSADQISVTAAEAKAPSNALGEVIDFCFQTMQHPEARLRQTGTVLQGIVVGGLKDIPNEFMNHPLETCGKVVVAGTLGTAAGAAIALEIPLVTGITIGTGVTMLGVGIIDSCKRMSSDKQLQSALSSVWKDSDFYTQMQANDTAEKVLGPEAFNWSVTLPAGLAGCIGGNIATKMVAAKLLSGKTTIVPADTPEVLPAAEQPVPAHFEDAIKFDRRDSNGIQTGLSDGTCYVHPESDWNVSFPDGSAIGKYSNYRVTHFSDESSFIETAAGEHIRVMPDGRHVLLHDKMGGNARSITEDNWSPQYEEIKTPEQIENEARAEVKSGFDKMMKIISDRRNSMTEAEKLAEDERLLKMEADAGILDYIFGDDLAD